MNTAAHGSNDTCEFYHIGFSLRFRGDKNETNEMLACFSFYKLSGSNKLQCCFCPPGLSAHYVTHQPNHLNTLSSTNRQDLCWLLNIQRAFHTWFKLHELNMHWSAYITDVKLSGSQCQPRYYFLLGLFQSYISDLTHTRRQASMQRVVLRQRSFIRAAPGPAWGHETGWVWDFF